MGRPRKIYDLDGSCITTSTTSTKPKKTKVIEKTSSDISFSSKEMELLNRLVEYFQLMANDLNKGCTFAKLKDKVEAKYKEKHQITVDLINKYPVEYAKIWTKLGVE